MRQRRDGLRLALEPRERRRILGKALGQDLDGDIAIQLGVAGAVDLAHAAGAELADDFVGAETRAWGKGHG